jgi:uncharacterized membrane protein YsdA (DUF1294 family)
MSPLRIFGSLGLLLAAVCTVGLWYALGLQNRPLPWLACWFAAVNAVAFLFFGLDKWFARSDRLRIPEWVLHALSAFGGSPGAFAAMKLFRHKTIKGSFRIFFWCIVAVQLLSALWIVKKVWWE